MTLNIQEFIGVLQKKQQLTPDVLYLSFKIPLDFSFKAGQFVSLSITKDGIKKQKSYSILSSPSKKGYLDLCVKIIERGFASNIFIKSKPGDHFVIKGPFGHFLFDNSVQEHWFIGAGTGLTPLYSIIQSHLTLHSNHNFSLLIGYKKKEDMLFHRELQLLQQKHKNFTYIPTLSRENWEGKMGRVQQHLGNNLQNKNFYICGLKELVLETKDYLLQQNVPKERIHFERYN